MPQPQWVVGTPPAQPAPPIGWSITQNSDGSISVIAGALNVPGVVIETFFPAGVTRAALSTSQAQQVGIAVDASGKVITN